MVRCFEDDNVIHVEGRVDPVADVGTIDTELCLKDLETVDKRIERAKKALKAGRPIKEDKNRPRALRKAASRARPRQAGARAGARRRGAGPAARHGPADAEEGALRRQRRREAARPALPATNCVGALRAHAETEGAPLVVICAAAEAEIAALDAAERPAFLESLGLKEPGLHAVAHTGYEILGLITFFTAGPDECRAWTVKRGAKAPQAAGVIHTDFERGFIKAEVILVGRPHQVRLRGGLPRRTPSCSSKARNTSSATATSSTSSSTSEPWPDSVDLPSGSHAGLRQP